MKTYFDAARKAGVSMCVRVCVRACVSVLVSDASVCVEWGEGGGKWKLLK